MKKSCVFCGKPITKGGDFVKNHDKKFLCKTCVVTAYNIFLNAEPINKMNKWEWMMEYCKNRSVSPAQQWAWEKAEKAYNNRNTFFDEPFCFVYAPYIPRYFSKYCHLFKPEKSPLKGLVSINPNTNQIWIYDGISWREKHNFNRNLRRLGVIR